jgi:hypothetical protein
MGQQADAIQQRQGLLSGDRLVKQLVIARGEHHVIEHRAVGEQVEALEDHADAPHPGAHLAFIDDGSALQVILAVENDLPPSMLSRALMVRIRVVLPEPDGPMMLMTSPFSTFRSMPFST